MRYASIRKMDISNGNGIGISLFVQGCPFHCPNCFNTDTWDFNGGKEWTDELKKKFVEMSNNEHITRVSILGGEPLAAENLEDVFSLVQSIKESAPSKTIWLYTGYTWEEIMHPIDKLGHLRQQIVANCDVLVDGRYVEALKDVSYPWAGSTNQRIIDVKISLENNMAIKYGDR